MKIREVIDRVDVQRPNAFDEQEKIRWLSELEGRLALNVYDLSQEEMHRFRYRCPGDLDTELLVAFPYDEIYYYWLCARIDAENGEANRYHNSVELYNGCLSELVQFVAARYGVGQCPPEHNGFFISAYGLACKAGFGGTLEQWLASLVGPQGPQGIPGAKLRIGAVSTIPVGDPARATVEGTAEDPVLNLWIPSGTAKMVKRDGDVMEGHLDMDGNILHGLPVNMAGYNGNVPASAAVSAGILPELMFMNGIRIVGSTKDTADLCYGTTSFDELVDGAYLIEEETIHGISEGIVILKRLTRKQDPGQDTALEWLISSDGEQIWMRLRWNGEVRPWKQLSFGYGAQLPDDGAEGRLYFLEG